MPSPLAYNQYPFDPYGTNPTNLITGEQQILTPSNGLKYQFFIPQLGPYFGTSLQMTIRMADSTTRPLVENQDYWNSYEFISASLSTGQPIYAGVQILDPTLAGVVTLQYQTLGGEWVLSPTQIATILATAIENPRVTAWEQVTGTDYPNIFPVTVHAFDLQNLVNMTDVVNSLANIVTSITNQTALLQAEESQPGSYSVVQANLQINAALANLGALPANLGTLNAGFLDAVSWTHDSLGGVGSTTMTPAAVNIDFLAGGNSQSTTVTGPVTFSFINLPGINEKGFIYLDLYNGGSATVDFIGVNWVLPNQTITNSFATYLSQVGISLNSVGPNFLIFWTSGVTANQLFGRFFN